MKCRDYLLITSDTQNKEQCKHPKVAIRAKSKRCHQVERTRLSDEIVLVKYRELPVLYVTRAWNADQTRHQTNHFWLNRLQKSGNATMLFCESQPVHYGYWPALGYVYSRKRMFAMNLCARATKNIFIVNTRLHMREKSDNTQWWFMSGRLLFLQWVSRWMGVKCS